MTRSAISIERLIALYRQTGSCNAVARAVGGNRTSVHERLSKAGIVVPIEVFTDEERGRLRREYATMRDANRLDELCRAMGRPKTSVCREARRLGLTDRNAPKPRHAVWKYMSDEAASAIFEDFKSSSLGLGRYCRSKGYDDLGFSRTMRERFPDEWEHVIEIKAPKTSKYKRGRAFEYAVRDRLRALGWVVLRSPASKSPLDLMAVRHGAVAFVQCKVNGQCPPAEWNELFDLADSCGAVPVLAWREGARGLGLARMTGRKDGSRRAQPMEPWTPEPAEQAGRAV